MLGMICFTDCVWNSGVHNAHHGPADQLAGKVEAWTQNFHFRISYVSE